VRALCLLIILAAAATEAKPAPRWIPPIERACREDTSWDKLQKCIQSNEPGSTTTALADDVKLVGTTSARQYLFVRIGDKWRDVYRPGDPGYELVSATEFQVQNKPARRIVLSHHVPMGNTGLFLERVTLVCALDAAFCTSYVTACTVMNHGRAVETFRGELREVDGALTLVGDRSHVLGTCSGR
jgi:hypothetical protein